MTEIDEKALEAAFIAFADETGMPRDGDEEVAIRAAILAYEAAKGDGWLPIESAPKDGTAIIGAFWSIPWADSHRKGDVVRCWWQPEFEAFISSCRQMTMAPGYTINGKTSELHSPVVERVTHWRPMLAPSPPEPSP